MAAAPAQERDRAKTPERYTWNLAEVYPTDAAWRQAKEALAAKLAQLGTFQGRLASSAATLADPLDTSYGFDKELSRLDTDASLLADQGTRDATHHGVQEVVRHSPPTSRRRARSSSPSS